MHSVLEALTAVKSEIRDAVLQKDYKGAIKLINDVCTPFIPAPNSYDMFRDIVPYTADVSKELGIEYVNASFIPFSNIVYIACQHPKPEYHDLFHEFLEASKARIIVSLLESPVYFSHEHVIEKNEVYFQNKKFLVEELCVFGNNRSKITRIHCTVWRDRSTLSDEEMGFLCDYVEEFEQKAGMASLHSGLDLEEGYARVMGIPREVVHCLAGVGRTGTFIMYKTLRKLPTVSLETLLDLLVYLRSCRHCMVESSKQLQFLVERFCN